MSDEEESFVILNGSSPASVASHRPSLQNFNLNHLQDTPSNCLAYLQESQIRNNQLSSILTQDANSVRLDTLNLNDDDLANGISSNNSSLKSVGNKSAMTKSKDQSKSNENSVKANNEQLLKTAEEKSSLASKKLWEKKDNCLQEDGQYINNLNISVLQNSIGVNTSSLAASFILGESDCNDLKQACIYTKFPSFAKVGTNEEIAKLQELLCENIEQKKLCEAAERVTRQYYAFCKEKFAEVDKQISDLKKENLDLKQSLEASKQKQNEKNDEKFEEIQAQYEQLKEQNQMLQKEVSEHNNHLQITTQLYQKDLDDAKRTLSERDGRIENMRHYIEKQEKEHSTFEIINLDIIKKNEELEKQKENFREMETKLNALETENEQLKVQHEFHKVELHSLKLEQIQAEELLKAAKADIGLLQAKDIDKENLIRTMQSEIEALKHQAQVYYADFDMERKSREQLAGERDKLILDLKALQNRNQKLTAQLETTANSAEGNMNSLSSIDGAVGGSNSQTQAAPAANDQYRCPVCCKLFINTSVLQSHVNYCLDNIK